MSSNPRVSVIITTYQRPALLAEAIDSVLAQSYRDFELIVADDGSNDETAERVTSYADRLRYLPLTNSGKPEVTRNRAARIARGHFLAFLDDDDLWREDKLMRQMALLEANDALGLVYSDCRFLHEDGTLSAPLLSPAQKDERPVFENLLRSCFIHPSTVVIRRDVFERLGPFDESLPCQGDYYLWLKTAQSTGVSCTPEPLVYLRISNSGLSSQRKLVNFKGAILAQERLRKERSLTLRQQWISRVSLSRWYAHLGLREKSVTAARRRLLRSLRLNPLQRQAWRGLWNNILHRPSTID